MFWFLKSEPTLSDELTNFIKQMGHTVKTLDQQAQAFSKLGPSMMSLVRSESPNYQIFFEKVIDIYSNLARYYSRSAKEVDRALEDLRDINHRYVVVKRLEGERANVKQAFDVVSENCDNVYKMMNPEKPDTVSNYDKAFKMRQEAAQKLFDADTQLLDYNKRFRLFTVRRVKSAWSRYGKALTTLYTLEAGAYSELSTLFKAIRDHYKEPEKVLNALKMNVPPAIFEKMLNSQTKTEDIADDANIEQLLEHIVIPPIPNYIKDSNDVILEIPRSDEKQLIKQTIIEVQKEQQENKQKEQEKEKEENAFSDDDHFGKAKILSSDEHHSDSDHDLDDDEVIELSDNEKLAKSIHKEEKSVLTKEETERLMREAEEAEKERKELEEFLRRAAEEEDLLDEEEDEAMKEEEEKLLKEEQRLREQEEQLRKQEEEMRLEEEKLRKEQEEKKKEEELKKKQEEEKKKEEELKKQQEEEKKKEEQSKAASKTQPAKKSNKNKNKKKGRGKKW